MPYSDPIVYKQKQTEYYLRRKAQNNVYDALVYEPIKCKWCHSLFTPKNSIQVLCSAACRSKEKQHLKKLKPKTTNPKKQKEKNKRNFDRYGITEEQFNAMYEEQQGKCFICGIEAEASVKNTLFIDHCHKSGKVRKLLCHGCNCALGYFKDDPTVLRKAAEYVEQY